MDLGKFLSEHPRLTKTLGLAWVSFNCIYAYVRHYDLNAVISGLCIGWMGGVWAMGKQVDKTLEAWDASQKQWQKMCASMRECADDAIAAWQRSETRWLQLWNDALGPLAPKAPKKTEERSN